MLKIISLIKAVIIVVFSIVYALLVVALTLLIAFCFYCFTDNMDLILDAWKHKAGIFLLELLLCVAYFCINLDKFFEDEIW